LGRQKKFLEIQNKNELKTTLLVDLDNIKTYDSNRTRN
jgi:hypothetical protein